MRFAMKKLILFTSLVLSAQFCNAQDLYFQIFTKINAIRKENHLQSLTLNDKLTLAAQSQSDWMTQIGKMLHLRQAPTSFDQFKKCNHHTANRLINAGYFEFDDLFSTNFQDKGVVVNPKPIANTNLNEIIAFADAGHQAYNTNTIVNGWMNSPKHKKVILDPIFEEFGIGITSLQFGKSYWCVVFAVPK